MLLLLLLQTGGPVRVTAKPDPIYIERAANAARLEFDFRLEGLTDDTVRLVAIRLTARDRTGSPWSIRFVDESGSDPGILTIPRREIAGRRTMLVYNPFFEFPPEAPIERLDYELTFAKGESRWTVLVEVRPVEYRQRADLVLPLNGRVLVFDGHDYYSHHRRVDYENPIFQRAGLTANPERYGHDLSLVDSAGRMFRGDGKRNEDWYSWGVPVRAPGAGRVVAVETNRPDYDVGNPAVGLPVDTILARPTTLMGNYVMIDHGGGVISRLFHLMRGSVSVRPGQTVAQGQVLGRVGFSGSVYTIHTHYEVGTGTAVDAEGLPLYLSRFRRIWGRHSTHVARGPIDSGDIVEQP